MPISPDDASMFPDGGELSMTLESLFDELQNSDAKGREKAAVALLSIENKSGKSDFYQTIWNALASRIAVDPSVVRALTKALGDAKTCRSAECVLLWDRSAATIALLVELLQGKDADAQLVAANILDEIGAGAAAAVPALVVSRCARWEARLAVVSALGKCGPIAPAAILDLFAAIRDMGSSVWTRVAEMLGDIGTAAVAAAPVLTEAIYNELRMNNHVHFKMIDALVKIGTPATVAVPVLIHVLHHDMESSVRTRAAEMLGDIGTAAIAAAPALTELMFKALQMDKHVDHEIIDALVKIGAPATVAVPALLNVLGHELRGGQNSYSSAARALGEIGPAAVAAVPALIGARYHRGHWRPVEDDYVSEMRRRRDTIEDWEQCILQALSKIGVPAVVATLGEVRQSLADNDRAHNARRVLPALSKEIGLPAVPSLLDALHDAHTDVRRAAASALGCIGPEAAHDVAPLILITQSDPDQSVRLAAIGSLRQIRVPDAVDVLVLIAQSDPDQSVRLAAIGALGAIPIPDAVDFLVLIAQSDPNPSVRLAAIDALGTIGPAAMTAIPLLLEVAQKQELPDQSKTIEALRGICRGSIDAISVLANAARGPAAPMRRIAITALGIIRGDAAIYPVLDALNDEDAGIRQTATKALNEFFRVGPDLLPALCAALNNPDAMVRRRIVKLVTMMIDGWYSGCNTEYVLHVLVQSLHDLDVGVRNEVVGVIDQSRNPKLFLPGLVKALHDQDVGVRITAAETLGRESMSGAIPDLVEALNDPEAKVRRVVAAALFRIRTIPRETFPHVALTALCEALFEDDPNTRRDAVWALVWLGPAKTEGLIGLCAALCSSEFDVRSAAEDALKKLGVGDVPTLIGVLGAANATSRYGAAITLGRIVSRAKGDIEVQAQAIPAVSTAIPFLLEMLTLDDERVRTTAENLLCWIGMPAISALVPLMQHKNAKIREQAARLVANIGPVNASDDPEIIALFGDSAAGMIPQLRVFWEIGKIIEEEGGPVGYKRLHEVLEQKKNDKEIDDALPTSGRMLPKHVKTVERLYKKRFSNDKSKKPCFVMVAHQGKRPVTMWTDQAWDAWRLVGRYLRAFGQNIE